MREAGRWTLRAALISLMCVQLEKWSLPFRMCFYNHDAKQMVTTNSDIEAYHGVLKKHLLFIEL